MSPVHSPKPTPTRNRRHDRKKVEMLFAHLKRILRLARLRLRGPSGAQCEFTLAAIAQNLRRLAKLATQPPPENLVACVAWKEGQIAKRVIGVEARFSRICASMTDAAQTPHYWREYKTQQRSNS
jgi:hypothetical protein